MSKNDQILRKLMLAQENPDLNIGFKNEDLAKLVIQVMGAVRDIETAIKNGRLDGKTPVAGKDYEPREAILKALNDYKAKTTADVEKKTSRSISALEKEVKDMVSKLTDGEDGIVTDAEIERAAEIAAGLIDLPDFDSLVSTTITTDGAAVRDALELLQGDDRLSIDAISGTENWKKEMEEISKRNPNAGLGGFGPNTVRKMIAESSGGLPDQSGNNGKFLTTDGTDPSWATLAGGGDMAAATYDPAGGAAQVAFASELHDAVTVTDSAEIDLTLTGQDLTASLKAGSIDESKLDTSVNASLDLADSATQPGDNISTLTNDSGFTSNAGDVVGPASAVNNAFVQFDTTTGKLIKESTINKISTDLTIISALDDEIATTKAIKAYTNAFTDADESKLDGIEASADVTDTANVTAAGALMDSEVTNLAQVKAFDSSDYATASHTHLLAAGATDVTATAAEVNILDGVTATTAELNYVDGVTSNIQTQLNAKAPTASPTLTGTTTTDTLVYDAGIGTVSALGTLGATELIDWSTATYFTGTLDQACAITHSNETSGQKILIALTGEFLPTFSDVDSWIGGSAPAAPGAGETLLVTLIRLGTTVHGSHELSS